MDGRNSGSSSCKEGNATQASLLDNAPTTEGTATSINEKISFFLLISLSLSHVRSGNAAESKTHAHIAMM